MQILKRASDHVLKNKYRIAMASFALMLCVSLIGVNAWLADASGAVVNSFEPAKVDVTIGETDTRIDDDDDPDTNSYEIKQTDGEWDDIEKDPAVTVPTGVIDCWVFVKIEEINDFSRYMTYEIEDGWTALEGYDGVYYRMRAENPENQSFSVLKDNKVIVKDSITKDEINALTESTYPKLKISGFAIQLSGFDTAETAWTYLNQVDEDPEP